MGDPLGHRRHCLRKRLVAPSASGRKVVAFRCLNSGDQRNANPERHASTSGAVTFASTRSFRQAIAQRLEQEPKGAVERAKRGAYVRRLDRNHLDVRVHVRGLLRQGRRCGGQDGVQSEDDCCWVETSRRCGSVRPRGTRIVEPRGVRYVTAATSTFFLVSSIDPAIGSIVGLRTGVPGPRAVYVDARLCGRGSDPVPSGLGDDADHFLRWRRRSAVGWRR